MSIFPVYLIRVSGFSFDQCKQPRERLLFLLLLLKKAKNNMLCNYLGINTRARSLVHDYVIKTTKSSHTDDDDVSNCLFFNPLESTRKFNSLTTILPSPSLTLMANSPKILLTPPNWIPVSGLLFLPLYKVSITISAVFLLQIYLARG